MRRIKYLMAIIFSLFIIGPFTVKAEEIVTCNFNDIIIGGKIRTDANNCDKIIVNNPKNLNLISNLTWLKEIEFINLKLDNISFINDLNDLETLIISGSNINLKGLNSNIESLKVYNSYVQNLEELKNCRYLENIILSDTTYFRDLNFLKYTPKLKTLSIDFPAYTNIDLSPISNLYRLEKLNLWGLEQNISNNLLNFLKRNNVDTSFSLNRNYESLMSNVKSIYNSLNLNGLSDEEQIQRIVLYVIDNITYDQNLTGEAGQEAFKTEIMIENALNKSGVCRQYTLLTNILLEMAGFNAIQIRSNATENHIWNAVYLDGAWYAIDPTWLDTEEGRNEVANNLRNKYYLVDPNGTYFDNHHPLSNMLSTLTPLFKITFDTNGGENLAPIYIDSNHYSLPAPTKQNSEFDGWYSDDALLNNYEVTNINKDVTLYAGYNDSLRIENASGMPNPPTSVVGYIGIGILTLGLGFGYYYLKKYNKFKKI